VQCDQLVALPRDSSKEATGVAVRFRPGRRHWRRSVRELM